MIQLQQLTGMRSGELCAMRPINIDTSGPFWIYEPATHKNHWRGHRRLIALGPGHARLNATEIYAEKNFAAVVRIASEVG